MADHLPWRIYYTSGATYDSAPEDAPERGVQCIVTADPTTGRAILSKFDFYCWHEDREVPWDGHDIFGLFDYLASPGWKRVVFGESIPNEAFAAIHEAAENDPDFAPRSAATAREQAVAP